ncbi:MAG TPA: site-2 protease family protein [Acidimicrobiales bacterium]|nr:site-2 protease family protein [Acidimicrobiales bacterium]
MRQSIRLGRIAGISVGCNWSVLVIVALFAWELAAYVLPTRAGAPDAADWVGGVIGAVVLSASLLAHEVSHALVAKRNDVRVRAITLFVFGGVTQLEGEAHDPGADLRIAAVGPGTSVALGALFAGAGWAASGLGVRGLPLAVLSWLWKVNLLLAGFNLIPAAPLDGGRILRSGLWHRSGDRDRATVTAARVGRCFAVVLVALGAVGFLAGGLLGLWPALIGLFLYMAARAEEDEGQLRARVGSLPVGQVMTPRPPAVAADMTVDELVGRHLWGYHGNAVVALDRQGHLVGVLTAGAVRALEPGRRPLATVAETMTPLAGVAVGHPEEAMTALLGRMASMGTSLAVVLDAQGHLAGVVSEDDLRRASAGATGRGPGGIQAS